MKKLMRKLLAVVAAMTMVMGLAVTANAQTASPSEGQPTGSATITVSNPTSGQTYSVYKLFDATTQGSGTSAVIAYTGTVPSSLSDYFEVVTGTTNNIKATTGHETIDSTESAALKAWAATQTPLATAISDGTTPLTFQNLPYGYYVVTTTLGAGTVSVTSTKPTGTVNDKNTTTPDDQSKTIVSTTDDLTNTATNVNASTGTAKVGDKVSYKVTFTANNYENDADGNPQKMTQYVVTDTNSGLNIDTDTVSITIQKQNGTDPLGNDQYASSTRKATITKATDNSGTVTITIPWVTDDDAQSFLYQAPATVTITYDATLTSTTGTNTVQVNNRSQKPTTTVDTATFKMIKVDGSDTTKALTGAEFDLYDAQTDGHQVKVTKGTDGTYTVDPNGTDKIVVDSEGKATIKGLKESTTYYLQETKAPAGYTLPTARISITTGATKDVPTTDTQITNTKGTELPSTGGMGTTIFYVLGAALVIGAGVVLVTRRRLSR